MNWNERFSSEFLQIVSKTCFVCGFLSIIASIIMWYLASNGISIWANPDQAHAERFGIFVGLWAPTFFILSQQFESWTKK
jgi:hypothetical protein